MEGGGGLIHELERRLRVTEPVIKFITVRIDEEQKRLDKIKAIRDAQDARPRPRPGHRNRRRNGRSHSVTVVSRRSSVFSKTDGDLVC